MKLILKESKSKKHPNWIMPSFEDEEGEFNRYNFSEQELSLIKNSFVPQNIIELNNSTWKKVNNTDSWETTNINQAIQLAKEYGKDYERVLRAFETNSALPCPIILKQKSKYELIAGNTRLMIARALEITPKVLMINL